MNNFNDTIEEPEFNSPVSDKFRNSAIDFLTGNFNEENVSSFKKTNIPKGFTIKDKIIQLLKDENYDIKNESLIMSLSLFLDNLSRIK